jgi:competence protein ComEC
LLAFSWTLVNFQLRLEDRLEARLSGQVLTVCGVISSVPQVRQDSVSFHFEPQSEPVAGSAGARLPGTLLVRWFEEWPAVSAGQVWCLDLLLKPPWGPINFQGPDRERWLFAEGIGAVASVRDGTLIAPAGANGKRLIMLRESISQQIREDIPDVREAGIVAALAVADRSGISRADRHLLALTGTSHLLAISGLHIGLAAIGGLLVARWLGWLLPPLRPGRWIQVIGLGGGAAAAAAYAALAGFGVPTVRSLVMLLVLSVAITMARTIHPGRAWLLAMAAVLLSNPFAALGAGFWFSFIATGALLWAFVPRGGQRNAWQRLLLAQAAIMVVLLPVSAFWFQAVSLAAFAANLVAIPLVSFGIVPLVLTGVAAQAVSGALSAMAWGVAGKVSGALLAFLEILAAIQGEMTHVHSPGLIGTMLAVLGALLLLLPRGMPLRLFGPFLLAPLFLPVAHGLPSGAIEVEVLDVGQGTAALITTSAGTLLYDSGPGDGAGRDLVASAIVPAINQSGARGPQRIIISHGDQDHAGGLGSLRARYPAAIFNANLSRPVPGIAGCYAPDGWRWQDTSFTVLHPTRSLPYLANDSSCVILVEAPGGSVLLSGDISTAVEARLLFEGLPRSQLLLVPHHGSRTSSSAAFLAALKPSVSIATAGLGNRFGFPREEVRRRYTEAGIRFCSTGECGAMRVMLHNNGELEVLSALLARPAIWRWPAAVGCPGGSRLR